MIEKENQLNNKINYEGELELRFILSNSDLQVDNRVVKIPLIIQLKNSVEMII